MRFPSSFDLRSAALRISASSAFTCKRRWVADGGCLKFTQKQGSSAGLVMEEETRQEFVISDVEDLSEREDLLFDVTNSQAYKAGRLDSKSLLVAVAGDILNIASRVLACNK